MLCIWVCLQVVQAARERPGRAEALQPLEHCPAGGAHHRFPARRFEGSRHVAGPKSPKAIRSKGHSACVAVEEKRSSCAMGQPSKQAQGHKVTRSTTDSTEWVRLCACDRGASRQTKQLLYVLFLACCGVSFLQGCARSLPCPKGSHQSVNQVRQFGCRKEVIVRFPLFPARSSCDYIPDVAGASKRTAATSCWRR